MTRQEATGERKLIMSQWVRSNLPDSNTGFMASDLDFIFENWRTCKIALLEVKTHKKDISKRQVWQKMLFENFDRWMSIGMQHNNKWEYKGFFILVFENECFNDGRAKIARFYPNKKLQYKLITEQEMIDMFSF